MPWLSHVRRLLHPHHPRIPMIGERVRRPGSDIEYEITYVSVDYRFVHLGFPRTNLEHRYINAATLIYLEQREAPPPKPYVDTTRVMEHLATVQRGVLRHLAGELAAAKKYLKAQRAPAEAAEALDTLREQHEVAWNTTAEKIKQSLEQ